MQIKGEEMNIEKTQELRKSKQEYPIKFEHRGDMEYKATCPNCKKGELFCGWGFKSKECPICGQKIKWE